MFKHLALATAAFGMLSSPVLADENAQMTRGEEKLAKLLDGRVAGEPQSCIRTLGSRNLSQIDGTALTYRDGDTVWVNYTRNPERRFEFELGVDAEDDPIAAISTGGQTALSTLFRLKASHIHVFM